MILTTPHKILQNGIYGEDCSAFQRQGYAGCSVKQQ
jgi:hypothetical protein